MRTIAEKYIDEGIEKGIVQGIQVGKAEGIQLGKAEGKAEGEYSKAIESVRQNSRKYHFRH